MTRKRFTFLVAILLLSFINFTFSVKASDHKANNNYALRTIAKIVPAQKLSNGKDAYEVVMRHNKANTKDSHYKNAQKIKHGYSISYYNDVDMLTIYRVTLVKNNIVKIQKQHDKKIITLNHKKILSNKGIVNILKNELPYKNMDIKIVSKNHNWFVAKVFTNKRYLGKYSLKLKTRKYNRIVEYDSRFLLPSNLHEKILNNEDSKKLSNAVKTFRKYRNKKINDSEKRQYYQAKQLIAQYNKLG